MREERGASRRTCAVGAPPRSDVGNRRCANACDVLVWRAICPELPFLGLSLPGKANPDGDADGARSERLRWLHRWVGRALVYVLIPLHLLTNGYHYSQGRDIIRRISPFI